MDNLQQLGDRVRSRPWRQHRHESPQEQAVFEEELDVGDPRPRPQGLPCDVEGAPR